MDKIRERLQVLGVKDEQLLKEVNAAAVAMQRKEEELEKKDDELEQKDQKINHYEATLFCSIYEALPGAWQSYHQEDYAGIVRNWDAFSSRITGAVPDHYLVDVYNRTRIAAMDGNLVASHSQSLLSNQRWKPVRLCSFPNSANFADKAHLCPKTAIARKCDTWIYAVAAVLGMPCDTDDEQRALIKAICGSCIAGEQAKQWSGINCSQFNLLLFMEQGQWYDIEPSVIVAPVLSPDQAREWGGTAYEVLIICSDRSQNATAEEIAHRIGLTTTDQSLVSRATRNDLGFAVSLLSTVVKASAFCLEQKPAPPGQKAEKYWKEYRESLDSARALSSGTVGQPYHQLAGQVYVPTAGEALPNGKFVAKVNLSQMITAGSRPAFPDPVLVAYKSSINWTRLHAFKLMAEAEPHDARPRRRQNDVEVGHFSVPSDVTV